jgi:hypothetical protein
MPKCWSKSSKQASIGRAAAVLMFSLRCSRRSSHADNQRVPINCDYRVLSANFEQAAYGLVIARASDEWLLATQLSRSQRVSQTASVGHEEESRCQR